MNNRHKRVLWLLNHKTLMPYEVQLLIDLGFEVWTPKQLPKSSQLSNSVVDFTYDKNLTLPSTALARLNEFNFYEEEWSSDIIKIVNQHFGTVFTIPFSKQLKQVLCHFKSQILFRAYGLDNSQTYKNALQMLYGTEIYSDIYAAGKRFWFAVGYEELAEIEPPLITKQTLFLPLGVPNSFWNTANTYTGSDQRILFFCPNCVTNPYYAALYKNFKQELGDLPHVIIGTQDVAVNDPNVLGFVTDEALTDLYNKCSVFYYPSRELRHLHYSPIEAAIKGMPVIYYADSLLGRMTPEIQLGRSRSFQEARDAIEKILKNDQEFIKSLRAEQHSLVKKFSGEYGRSVWKKNLDQSGFLNALKKEKMASFMMQEITQRVLRPLKKHFSVAQQSSLLTTLLFPERKDTDDQSCVEGEIIFSQSTYPEFVWDIFGISSAEDWGRWSLGELVSIKFLKPLPQRFKLILAGGGYGPNIGKNFIVAIGTEKQPFVFNREPEIGQSISLIYDLDSPVDLIEITIPKPVAPPNAKRLIGLGLCSLKIVPF
ncbi:MAG TPA: hypothetical protein VHD33_05555 [Legionellaceae bacterium]|nr:hypothetical protein [Legionellaceae bacterium]